MAPKTTTETPAEAPAATLSKGEHNPFLEGLIQEGKAANEAIQGWYKTRDHLRTQARLAVDTGFASEVQAKAVLDLWPMPKRTPKDKAETTTADESAKTAA